MAEKRMFIVLLGAPGAGKGTQAKLLEEAAQLPQISTGDIFRFNLKNQTELGKLAKSYMDTVRGARRSDHPHGRGSAAAAGRGPGCDHGWLPAQSGAGYGLRCPGRPLRRRLCRPDDRCRRRRGDSAHHRPAFVQELWRDLSHVLYNPPKVAGVCDKDGGELTQRDDDREETVRNRLFVYYKQTAPLIGYYYAKGLLAEVDGMQPIEDVAAALKALLKV
jgi:adenylate kinase